MGCRSQEYCKYCLYCGLHGNSVHTQQISFCKGQEVDKVLFGFISHDMNLMGTLGQAVVNAWLACEGYKLSIDQDWVLPQAIARHCKSVPCLSEVSKCKLVSLIVCYCYRCW